MAKAIATCTCSRCGASFERSSIQRNRTEADSWEAWAKRNFTLCGACWMADQEAAEAEADAAYPPITGGSPKQIAWAIKIRLKAAKSMRDVIARRPTDREKDVMRRALDEIVSHTDARWYIDHRDDIEDGPIGGIVNTGSNEFWRDLIKRCMADANRDNG